MLYLFEQKLDLKINFYKSKVFCLGEAQERKSAFGEIFTCKSGVLPMKYLGIPVDDKRLKSSDRNPPGEKMDKKLGSWNGKNLLISGRSLLINTSLSSILLYMLSSIEF
jgi:hypothetical protein